MLRRSFAGACCAVVLGLAVHAWATTPVGWASWSDATVGNPGSVTGSMLFGTTTINMTYTGEVDFAETGSGTDYISPTSTYTSATVPNAPPGAELVALTGGDATVDSITYSSPVTAPLMAFVSLGQPGIAVTYNFNEPFSILSSGTGWWGGSVPLTKLPGNKLQGEESDGVIQFDGNFTSISWTVEPNGEYWDGYTFGALAVTPPGTPIGPFQPPGVPLPTSASLALTTLAAFAAIRLGRKVCKIVWAS